MGALAGLACGATGQPIAMAACFGCSALGGFIYQLNVCGLFGGSLVSLFPIGKHARRRMVEEVAMSTGLCLCLMAALGIYLYKMRETKLELHTIPLPLGI